MSIYSNRGACGYQTPVLSVESFEGCPCTQQIWLTRLKAQSYGSYHWRYMPIAGSGCCKRVIKHIYGAQRITTTHTGAMLVGAVPQCRRYSQLALQPHWPLVKPIRVWRRWGRAGQGGEGRIWPSRGSGASNVFHHQILNSGWAGNLSLTQGCSCLCLQNSWSHSRSPTVELQLF